jgi:mevalonate kinase
MSSASASAKIILFGEHAVVYGRPAIAVPLPQLRATAEIQPLPDEPDGHIRIFAPDIGLQEWLHRMDREQPLALIVHLALEALQQQDFPAFQITAHSHIPIAAGLGSGAAISVAIVRALAAHFGESLPRKTQSALAFQVEVLHHGTPSGIDNTVVAFEQPIYFVQGAPPEPLNLARPVHLVVGDTGIRSPTATAVRQVRQGWQKDIASYESLFDRIAEISKRARRAIERGELARLGELMNENQSCLAHMGVSTEQLEKLIAAAHSAGALGAKVCGAGLGGSMIALVGEEASTPVDEALKKAGAAHTFAIEVGA